MLFAVYDRARPIIKDEQECANLHIYATRISDTSQRGTKIRGRVDSTGGGGTRGWRLRTFKGSESRARRIAARDARAARGWTSLRESRAQLQFRPRDLLARGAEVLLFAEEIPEF